MTLVYVLKLGFKIYYINIKVQKINASIFKMFNIILLSFNIEDKLRKIWFF